MSLRFISNSRFIALLALAASGISQPVQAASVGNSGYTNDFTALPAAADWSTVSIAGASGTPADAAALDTSARATAASGITTPLSSDPVSPATAVGTASWSSLGLYVQTRPTGNAATLLMCTLQNATSFAVGSVTISYDFAKATVVTEEVEAHLAYYSTSGAANSWIPIPEFTSASPGRLSATLLCSWPAASTLYLLWADDNGSGSPDSAYQIDNFSAKALPVSPVSIVTQPQSQTNTIGAPILLSVVTAGSCPAYQWQTNNGSGGWANVAGATSSVYSNANGFNGFVGSRDYRVVVTGSANSVISSNATFTVREDTTGPLVLSAIVNPANSNNIVLTFNESLLAFGTTSTVANGVSPGVLTNGTYRVVLFGSNVNATVLQSSYNSGPPVTASLIMGTNNWFYQSNYYIILNNIRDFRTNVIAPNTIVPLSWPLVFSTNIFTPSSQYWNYYANYFQDRCPNGISLDPPYDCIPPLGPDLYLSNWWQTTYNDYEPIQWTPRNNILYYDQQETNESCFIGTPFLPQLGGTVDEPTLLRTWFMWPTNFGTNVTLKFDYVADDAAAFFLNGDFLFKDAAFPAGAITAATRATSGIEADCKTNTLINVAVRPGSNLIAVAVAQYRYPVAPINAPLDFAFALQLDATTTSYLTSPLPPNGIGTNPAAPAWSRTNRLSIARLAATNTVRISWPSNAYGFALESATNILGPWSQVQPGSANPYLLPGVVTGLRFTSANDAPDRDPTTYKLDGRTAPSSPWVTIATGPTLLPTTRLVKSSVSISNSVGYAEYRITFPTIRTNATADSMQIAEVELLDLSGTGIDVTAPGNSVTPTSANHSPSEAARMAIDDNINTKYRNFDKLNAGFIVSPAQKFFYRLRPTQ